MPLCCSDEEDPLRTAAAARTSNTAALYIPSSLGSVCTLGHTLSPAAAPHTVCAAANSRASSPPSESLPLSLSLSLSLPVLRERCCCPCWERATGCGAVLVWFAAATRAAAPARENSLRSGVAYDIFYSGMDFWCILYGRFCVRWKRL